MDNKRQWHKSLELLQQEQMNDILGHAACDQLTQKGYIDQNLRLKLKDSDFNNSARSGKLNNASDGMAHLRQMSEADVVSLYRYLTDRMHHMNIFDEPDSKDFVKSLERDKDADIGIKDLKARMDTVLNKIEEIDQERKSLKIFSQYLDKEHFTKYNALQSVLENKLERYIELESKYEMDIKAMNKSFATDIGSLQDQLQSCAQKLSEAEEQKNKCEDKYQKLKDENQVLKKKSQESMHILDEFKRLNIENQDLKETLSNVNMERESILSKANQMNAIQSLEFNMKLKQIEQEKMELQKSLASSNLAADIFSAQLKHFLSKNLKHETEKGELENLLRKFQQEVDTSIDQISSIKALNDKLENENHRLTGLATDLESQVELLSVKLKEYENNQENTINITLEIANLRNSLDMQASDIIKHVNKGIVLEGEKQELKIQLDQAQHIANRSWKNLKELQEKQDVLLVEKLYLEKMLLHVRAEYEVEFKKLQERISSQESEIFQLLFKFSLAESQRDEIQGDLEEFRAKFNNEAYQKEGLLNSNNAALELKVDELEYLLKSEKSKIVSQSEKNKELKEELEWLKQNLLELEKSKENLFIENIIESAKYSLDIESMMRKFISKSETLKCENEDLKNILDRLKNEAEIQTIETRIIGESKIAQLQEELESLKIKAAKSESEVYILSSEIKDLRKANAIMEDNVTKITIQNQQMIQDLVLEVANVSEQKSKVDEMLDATLYELSDSKIDSLQVISSMKEKLTAQSAKIIELECTRVNLLSDLRIAQANSGKVTFQEQKILDLELRIEELQTEKSVLLIEIDIERSLADKKISEVSEKAKLRIQELTSNVNDLEVIRNTLSMEILAIKNSISEVKESSNTQVEELLDKNSMLKEKCDRLDKDIQDHVLKTDQITKNVSVLDAKIKLLEQEKKDLIIESTICKEDYQRNICEVKETNAGHIRFLQSEIIALEDQINQLIMEMAMSELETERLLSERSKTARIQREAFSSKIQFLERERKENLDQIEEGVITANLMLKQIAEFKSHVESLLDQISLLENEKQDLINFFNTQKVTSDESIRNLSATTTTEMKELYLKISILQREKDDAYETLKEFQDNRSKLAQKLQVFEDEKAQLLRELIIYQDESNCKLLEIEMLRSKVKSLENEKDTLINDVAVLKNETSLRIDSLIKERQDLTSEIEVSKAGALDEYRQLTSQIAILQDQILFGNNERNQFLIQLTNMKNDNERTIEHITESMNIELTDLKGKISVLQEERDTLILTISQNERKDEIISINKSAIASEVNLVGDLTDDSGFIQEIETLKEEQLYQILESNQRIPFDSEENRLQTFSVVNGKKQLKQATFPWYISFVLEIPTPDSMAIYSFLLHHTLFTTSKDLLGMLLLKWVELIRAKSQSLEIYMIRIANILNVWLKNFNNDIKITMRMSSCLKSLINLQNSDIKANEAMKTLLNVIGNIKENQTRLLSFSTNGSRRISSLFNPGSFMSTQNQSRCNSIISKAHGQSSPTFLQLVASEIAKQLTLVDLKYFKSMEPRELIDMNWTKDEKLKLSPNICKLAQWTSTASLWIAFEILSENILDQRALVLAHVIQVASELFHLKNLNGLKMIMNALSMKPIVRLKKTFQRLPPTSKKLLEDLKILVDEKRNFTEFRQISKSSAPPLVPYPTVYHRDLLSLQSLGDILFKEGDLTWINVDRINRTGVVIKGVIDCKKTDYNFEIDDSFINLINKSRRFTLADAQIISEKLEDLLENADLEEDI